MTKKTLIFLLPLLAFVVFVILLGQRLGKSPEIVTHTALQKHVPTFNLTKLDNPNVVLSNDDLPKHPFILNVWGSWCPTCRVEHPFLMQLHTQNIPMVGVNYQDEPKEALGYLAKHGDPFLYSVQDTKGDLALDLGLMGAPESFVVDDAGVVRLHIVGELHEQNWQDSVKPCLMALAGNDEQTKQQACRG